MRLLAVILLVAVSSAPALAIFIAVPPERVEEVPVERLLANLERNVQGLSESELARAVGRVHLLAYLRSATTLPVYYSRQDQVADGLIRLCSAWEAEQHLWPWPLSQGPGPERCAEPQAGVGLDPEIPRQPSGASLPADAHVAAAITAYTRAKALDPSNLRTRVALAFLYDRAGAPRLALDELRFAATEGLRRLGRRQPAPGDEGWETRVVVGEAAEHLALDAQSLGDRRLAARVKARLDATKPTILITPVLVPLRSEGDLVDRASPVTFDFSGQGLPMRAGWLTPNAAWLVWDPDHRRRVSSGFQLFGSVTWMAFWETGYQALATLDDDGDGRIADGELAGLALWQDRNTDGVCDDGEVAPVASYGIVALGYAHVRLNDEFWTSPAGVTFRGGESRPTYDWLLRGRPGVNRTH